MGATRQPRVATGHHATGKALPFVPTDIQGRAEPVGRITAGAKNAPARNDPASYVAPAAKPAVSAHVTSPRRLEPLFIVAVLAAIVALAIGASRWRRRLR